MRARRRGKLPLGGIVIVLLALAAIGITWANQRGTGVSEADNSANQLPVVQRFYEAEQAGDFGSAWEMFHPLMKERFDKADYIQQKARLFMQDLGANTFDFTVGEATMLTSWQPDGKSEVFSNVLQMKVTMTFHGRYGELQIVQPCYVVENEGHQTLLWAFRPSTDHASAISEGEAD